MAVSCSLIRRALGVVRLFRLPREEYNRLIKLYPSDEDIIYQNLSLLSDDDKVRTPLPWACQRSSVCSV